MKALSSLIMLCTMTACSVAPDLNMSQLNNQHKQKRIAVVVANSTYQGVEKKHGEGCGKPKYADSSFMFCDLKTSHDSTGGPEKSAEEMSNILAKQGFDVYKFKDTDLNSLNKAVTTLKTALNTAGDDAVGLFFYSGHGYQLSQEVDEDSYLIPSDFPELNRDAADFPDKVREKSVKLSDIIETLRTHQEKNTKSKPNKNGVIIALDSCRGENQVAGVFQQSQGVFKHTYGPKKTLQTWSHGFTAPTKVGLPSNFIVSFATKAGDVDMADAGQPSDYVRVLTQYLARTDLSVYDVFDKVNKETRKRAEEIKSSSSKDAGQIATFIHGEDPEGFFKETYLSGKLNTISPSAHP
jgi:uncharacterized caspase-like protein